MDRNRRVTIFLTLVALLVLSCVGFVMYMIYAFIHGLVKVTTDFIG